MALSSLLTTEVWVRSSESVGPGEKEEVRPVLRYRLSEDAWLRDAAMDLSPGGNREDALPVRDGETGNREESPKSLR